MDELLEVNSLDEYRIDSQTLVDTLNGSAQAIRRLRLSPSEEARKIGNELEEVYLDLKAAMARNCHLVELWGPTMAPPAPRQVEGKLLQMGQQAVAAAGGQEP